MAENINISFAPNKSASESQRIADLEQYVSTLTERTKFAFASIIEEYNDTSADDEQTVNMIYQATSESGSDVGQFTNTDRDCEIFNDYSENIAQSHFSHAEGSKTSATAPYAHAEGHATTASAPSAHAEGDESKATNSYAHAEGRNTQATGYASHAEGENTTASGYCSHAEGYNATASGGYSHAEGYNAVASGWYSHAGGINSEAKAEASFAHGEYAVSNYRGGAAFGLSNKTKDALFVVGNGSPQGSYESDALVLDNAGNLWVAGKLTAENQNTLYGLAIEAHGAVRFGNNWTSNNANILLAVGNGYDSERLRDALTLDSDGNLTVSGKYSSAKGYDFSNAIASDTALGAIKVGENLSISEDGTLSASGGNSYVLPSATADTLGGVMIGDNISVTADGVISVNLSEYLKSDAISDWAKAENKPAYTAAEVGAVTAEDMDAKTYLKAVDITGQTVDLNAYKLNQPADKGKSLRHFCSVATSENITNRPVSVSEPFELVTTNIRHASTNAYHTVQKYTSATRQRTYTRWCANGTWSAWKCDTDVVVYGSVTEDSPKTFAYATYGEGFGVVEIEAYYDNATNPVRNRKVFSLSPTASIERVMLTISNGSSESVTLANGTITMSMTGTTALSFVIRYTNSR